MFLLTYTYAYIWKVFLVAVQADGAGLQGSPVLHLFFRNMRPSQNVSFIKSLINW